MSQVDLTLWLVSPDTGAETLCLGRDAAEALSVRLMGCPDVLSVSCEPVPWFTDLPTPFGTVAIGPDSVSVTASGHELYTWAHRPGHSWPCSYLMNLESIQASFNTNGLVDLTHPSGDDISGDEVNAWSSDAIALVLPADHACYFVTVGQFAGPDACESCGQPRERDPDFCPGCVAAMAAARKAASC